MLHQWGCAEGGACRWLRNAWFALSIQLQRQGFLVLIRTELCESWGDIFEEMSSWGLIHSLLVLSCKFKWGASSTCEGQNWGALVLQNVVLFALELVKDYFRLRLLTHRVYRWNAWGHHHRACRGRILMVSVKCLISFTDESFISSADLELIMTVSTRIVDGDRLRNRLRPLIKSDGVWEVNVLHNWEFLRFPSLLKRLGHYFNKFILINVEQT